MTTNQLHAQKTSFSLTRVDYTYTEEERVYQLISASQALANYFSKKDMREAVKLTQGHLPLHQGSPSKTVSSNWLALDDGVVI